MAPADYPEDSDSYTYDDTIGSGADNPGAGRRSTKKGNPFLKKLFASCEEDALGSVHRAW
eukprot:CAMPEP_0183748600 /NCGR_PEP_ID=MMETSP0737-20130205/67859_1 /TAXON_ID=385413 /ORGANISM="Thalassiosira miniscula, Strain CCMP1093" /LENGTH=59 /DNA_ID=CAMNT_0025984337 /DNA_START=86 /DNA_END=262 /DNA_ORIENTATION=+